MGKQAKKKTDTRSEDQKKHNRGSRGINTFKRPRVWDTRQENYKDEDGLKKVRTVDVTYPNDTQWDWTLTHDAVVDDNGVTRLMKRKAEKQKVLQAPLNELLIDSLQEDIAWYAKDNEAKIERTSIGNGAFRYEIWKNEFSSLTNKKMRKVLLTVDSSQSINVSKKRKKFSRRK